MACEHCGKHISILSNYCEYCGKPVESFGKRASAFSKNLFDRSVSLCKKKKWLLPAVIGVIAVLIIVSVIANHEKSLDFAEYVSFEISGYDGFGTLDVSIDYDKLATDILGKEPNQESKKEYEKYIEYINDKLLLMSLISVSVDRNDDLKNGDFFLITVYVENNDIFEDNKIAVKDEKYTKTYEVGVDTEKLVEIAEINLFEHMSVEYSGVNGYGNATISKDVFTVNVAPEGQEASEISFQYYNSGWSGPYFIVSSSGNNYEEQIYVALENVSNLSNGDVVKMSLEVPKVELAEMFGIKILETEKDFTVSKLTEITEVNLFDYFTVEFTGENEYGRAGITGEEFNIDITPTNGEKYTLTLQYYSSSWSTPYFKVYSSLNPDEYESIYISFDNSRYLSNGDVVKAIVDADEEDIAKLLGIKISVTEKEYTVSGLTINE